MCCHAFMACMLLLNVWIFVMVCMAMAKSIGMIMNVDGWSDMICIGMVMPIDMIMRRCFMVGGTYINIAMSHEHDSCISHMTGVWWQPCSVLCMHGTLAKKPARLWVWRCEVTAFGRCCCSRGVCERSGQPHHTLEVSVLGSS